VGLGYHEFMKLMTSLTTEQKLLSALRIAPLSIQDVIAAGSGALNSASNLTRKNLAYCKAGTYYVTSRGMVA
jgi:hypothetical protein